MGDTETGYRIEELAALSDVGVDEIRRCEEAGLLGRAGRCKGSARYREADVIRMRTVSALTAEGYGIAQVQKVLGELKGDQPQTGSDRASAGLTRDELAEGSGLPAHLVDMAVAARLIEPQGGGAEDRFPPEAVPMLAAGMSLLEAGFPLDKLAALAARHATSVENVVDAAIDLFNHHVRDSQPTEPKHTAELFHTLTVHITRLVAQHFHHTVMTKVKERLESSEDEGLITALGSLKERQLVIQTEWR